MFTKHTSLVIPTRNRNNFLLKTLNQLKNFKIKFKEILVIDSSDKFDKLFFKEICNKFSVKFYRSKPSTSMQRNIGLKLRNKKSKFVMFLDDDIIFYGRKKVKYQVKLSLFYRFLFCCFVIVVVMWRSFIFI
jgi:glycosyltransferase involved in cell wall biosynthesis